MSRIWMSHAPHIWMSHVTRMNESCHTSDWVMSQTYECVMSHAWMSHAPHTNESCQTYEKRHVTHMNVSYNPHLITLTSSHSCCVNQPSLGAVTSRVYSIGAGLREANAPSPWTKQKKKGKKANNTEKIKLNKRITNKFSLRSLVLKLDRCWFTRGKCSQFLIRKKKEIKRK